MNTIPFLWPITYISDIFIRCVVFQEIMFSNAREGTVIFTCTPNMFTLTFISNDHVQNVCYYYRM